jgi:NitT/TauT family transport system ATP-binding protein
MDKNMKMIEVKDLFFAYRGQPPLFKAFSFSLRHGEAWAIIGPSGCGKTTLLYLIAGLRQIGEGVILIGGLPLRRPRPRTGLVLQDHGLLPWASVKDNIRLGLKIRAFYGPDGKHAPAQPSSNGGDWEERIVYWLKRMGIEDQQDKYPSQLSRGQRQRTAIARTLILSPDLLLLDEPFSALDAAIRYDLQETVLELHTEGNLTTLLVTHDIEEAAFMGKRILLLRGPANQDAAIIENSFAIGPDARNHPGFQERCNELRSLLLRQP